MDRFKSPVLWIAILAQIVVILQLTNAITISEIELINGIATSVIQILVLFGVLNNPTDKKSF